MRPGHVLSSSSSHSARSRPRSPNPGPVQHDPLDSTSSTPSTSSTQCNHHHQAASIGTDEGDGDALMPHIVEQEENEEDLEAGGDGEEKGQYHIEDSVTTSAEHGHLSEAGEKEDEEEDDDGGDDDDDESLCYGHPYHHQQLHHQHQALNHFLSQHEHEHAPTQNHTHDTDNDDDDDTNNNVSDEHDHGTPTQPPQPPFFSDLDGYISDDLDMSDADMSLATYLDIATILTSNNMDLDDAGSEFDYDFHSPNPHPTPPGYDPPSMPPAPPPAAENPSVPATTTPLPSAHIPQLTHMTFAASTYYIPPTAFTQSHMLSVSHITSQLQQLVAEADHSTGSWFPGGAHPIPLSGGGPGTLGPGNYNLVDFLHNWARQSRGISGLPRERGRYPWPSRIHELSSRPLTHVQYADLNGDQCDLQGLDWDDLGVTRKEARERRLLTYNNYVNQPGTDRWAPNLPDVSIPRSESYFRFRRTDIRHDVKLSHFQLRNILAGSSRTSHFYPTLGAVQQFDPLSGITRPIMKLHPGAGAQVSTLAADYNVLIAGCFNGEYVVKRLDTEDPPVTGCHDGTISHNASGITNQIQIHTSRNSSSLMAAFASNDTYFRMLDIGAQKWLSREKYDFPLNCSAHSPDKRLRVMVGDDHHVLITAAESSIPGRPEVIKRLTGHRDFGFACDWADDGWTVATGFQDKSIKIWDARWWTDSSNFPAPVCTLRAEMAGVRSLRFSPIGSGKRVLVAAEEADFVNIIDARSFRSKQTIDIFGEIGGINFTNDGQDLTVLCCDPVRGGLLQLERCGLGQEATWNVDDEMVSPKDYLWRRGSSFDWQPSQFTESRRIKERATRRRRKAAALDAMEPF